MTDLLAPGGWPLAGALLIFAARVTDVSLGTMRIVFVARGLRRLAPLVGFVEMTVWLIAISQLVQHLDRPLNYLAYAGGYATGTWLGLLLEARLALGVVAVQIISGNDVGNLAERLAGDRFGITTVAARGLTGRVRLLYSVIRRRELAHLLETVRTLEPEAFVSVSDVRLAREGYFAPPPLGRRRLLDLLRKK